MVGVGQCSVNLGWMGRTGIPARQIAATGESARPTEPVTRRSVFQDPVLDHLIAAAGRQNLSLREAGLRILQARAQLAITAGNLFPQSQQATGMTRISSPTG